MIKQLYFEDVEVGTEIPPMTKKTTPRQLVRWAGASGDFMEIHYDKDVAVASKLPGIINHGALKNAFLAQFMTDWIGEDGFLKKLGVQYRSMDQPGDALFCKGKVTKKYVESGENLVDCDIWIEKEAGEVTTPGHATVRLPSRSGS